MVDVCLCAVERVKVKRFFSVSGSKAVCICHGVSLSLWWLLAVSVMVGGCVCDGGWLCL